MERETSSGHFALDTSVRLRGPQPIDELQVSASQAAAVIANARLYCNEQRAKADLEALVETSPVGVVVFDAKTGQPTRFSRESRRIVERLRMPDRPTEQLLEVMACRRAAGREVSLSELPLAEQFGDRETVRAEEMVLSVPDGRSVRTLVNSTPIRSAAGTVESVVVTMQDLAPFDEIALVSLCGTSALPFPISGLGLATVSAVYSWSSPSLMSRFRMAPPRWCTAGRRGLGEDRRQVRLPSLELLDHRRGRAHESVLLVATRPSRGFRCTSVRRCRRP